MKTHVLLRGFCLSLACLSVAHAIPPPWEIEEMKSKADVIAIAEAREIETVEGAKRFNRKIVVSLIKVLQSDVKAQEHDPDRPRRADVFFFQPAPPRGEGGIAAVAVGGTGSPKPVVGEHALVFLRRLEEPNAFSVVCGSFGYIRLSAPSQEELRRVTRTIARHQEWSEKIADERARQAMVGYYREAMAFAEGHAGEKPESAD
jgi:hypothetical protein